MQQSNGIQLGLEWFGVVWRGLDGMSVMHVVNLLSVLCMSSVEHFVASVIGRDIL